MNSELCSMVMVAPEEGQEPEPEPKPEVEPESEAQEICEDGQYWWHDGNAEPGCIPWTVCEEDQQVVSNGGSSSGWWRFRNKTDVLAVAFPSPTRLERLG